MSDQAPGAGVLELVEESFGRAASDSLTDLNASGIARVCERLGLDLRLDICSRLGLDLPAVEHPGGWALEISTLLGASEYLNPPGGRLLFRPEEFAARNIRLAFTETPDFRYACPPFVFEPRLSMLDVLMWCAPEEILAGLEATQGRA